MEIEEPSDEAGCRPVGVRHGRGLAADDERGACGGRSLFGGARTRSAARRDDDGPKPDLSKGLFVRKERLRHYVGDLEHGDDEVVDLDKHLEEIEGHEDAFLSLDTAEETALNGSDKGRKVMSRKLHEVFLAVLLSKVRKDAPESLSVRIVEGAVPDGVVDDIEVAVDYDPTSPNEAVVVVAVGDQRFKLGFKEDRAFHGVFLKVPATKPSDPVATQLVATSWLVRKLLMGDSSDEMQTLQSDLETFVDDAVLGGRSCA